MNVLKRIGIAVAGLIGLLLIAVVLLYLRGSAQAETPITLPDETFGIEADSALVARGAYLVAIHACAECHGERLEGRIFVDAPPFRAVAGNLTAGEGGVGTYYTDADWEHAIRHGIDADGRGILPLMPSKLFHALSDDEMGAMIAYLETVAPVDNELPPSALRFLGKALTGAGQFPSAASPIDHEAEHLAEAPAHAATVAYGAHRAATLCTYCHGDGLRGGTQPVEPGTRVPPPLQHIQVLSLSQFATIMRTGMMPSGHQLNPRIMPWPAFQHMDDAEIEALYRYMKTLDMPGG